MNINTPPPDNEERKCACGNVFMTASDSPREQGCWDCSLPTPENKRGHLRLMRDDE